MQEILYLNPAPSSLGIHLLLEIMSPFPAYSGTSSVVQVSLDLIVLLSSPFVYWNFSHVPRRQSFINYS